MLSYHADADINTNPFEVGLDRLVALDSNIDFIGKDALQKIKQKGIKRKQVGLEIYCKPLQGPNNIFWPVAVEGKTYGKVTSAVYSPRLEKNIALAMMDINYTDLGQKVEIQTDFGNQSATVIEKPFFDPKKSLPSS